MKKLDYTYVKDCIESEGYKLLSTEYEQAHAYLDVICPSGHNWKITWAKWADGRRCKYCNKSISFIDIKHSVSLEGYELISDKYVHSKKKLGIICKNGHRCFITWACWRLGIRCKKCYNNRRRTKFDVVKNKINSIGYELLTESVDFYDSKSKINCICDKGHKFTTRWSIFSRTLKCPICNLMDRDNKFRFNIEYIISEFEKEDYKLLTSEYINAFQKLEYICPNGHKGVTKWNYWQQNFRCRKCAYELNSIRFTGDGHPNWKGGITCEPYCDAWADKEYKEDIKRRDGYKCLNPYCRGISKRLSIHHIDYNKKNCGPSNLITVCASCNAHANYDRDWHTEWYRLIMNKKYKYNYGGI